jgi:hypothetical protein
MLVAMYILHVLSIVYNHVLAVIQLIAESTDILGSVAIKISSLLILSSMDAGWHSALSYNTSSAANQEVPRSALTISNQNLLFSKKYNCVLTKRSPGRCHFVTEEVLDIRMLQKTRLY